MKNMVEMLTGAKGGLDPKVYLLIFLKFIQVCRPAASAPVFLAFSARSPLCCPAPAFPVDDPQH